MDRESLEKLQLLSRNMLIDPEIQNHTLQFLDEGDRARWASVNTLNNAAVNQFDGRTISQRKRKNVTETLQSIQQTVQSIVEQCNNKKKRFEAMRQQLKTNILAIDDEYRTHFKKASEVEWRKKLMHSTLTDQYINLIRRKWDKLYQHITSNPHIQHAMKFASSYAEVFHENLPITRMLLFTTKTEAHHIFMFGESDVPTPLEWWNDHNKYAKAFRAAYSTAVAVGVLLNVSEKDLRNSFVQNVGQTQEDIPDLACSVKKFEVTPVFQKAKVGMFV